MDDVGAEAVVAGNAHRVRRNQFPPAHAGWCHFGCPLQLLRPAESQQPRLKDVSDVGTAFRFVHVVRGHKQRDARRGQLEQQIPQLSPSDRIDAGRGLVEKQQLGFVDQRTGNASRCFQPPDSVPAS